VKTIPDLPAPIVPIAAAFLFGAACGGVRPTPEAAGVAACAAVLVACALRRRRPLSVLFLAAAMLALGAAVQGLVWRDSGRRLDAVFGDSGARELEIVARVVAAPETNREGGRELIVETILDGTTPELRLRLDIVDVPEDDGGRIDGMRRGDTVRAWCRLRRPAAGPGITEATARRRLAAQRLDATGRVKSSRLVRLVIAGHRSPGRTLDGARVRSRGALDRTVGTRGETRAVLGAMLLGDRLLLDEGTNALLRDAGLVHILSISGLHTAISVLLVLGLLRRFGLGARGVVFTGGAALLAFSTFVGHGASVWRACASLAVGLLARLLSRDVDPLAALALATVVLVVAVPPLAFGAAFLLSVVATAGLVAACPRVARGRRAPSGLTRAMAASSGAYLATAPLLAAFFGRLAPAAFVANLVAAPLCAACLASGAAAIVFASVPLANAIAAGAAKAAVAALLFAARSAAAIPGGHLRVASPPLVLALAYVAVLVTAGFWQTAWSAGGARAIRLLLALIVIALHLGPTPPGSGPTRAEVLDVGQGLAVVLRGPYGRFVLVDAGPSGSGRFDAGDRIVVPALAARGCHRLEVLALSHDHDDHAGGALAVLRDVEVGELWLGEGSLRDPLTRAVAAEAVARGVAVRRLKRGDIAEVAGLELAVLHPGLLDRSRSLNDRCLVLRVETDDGASILLPGDLEAGGERALLAAGADPRAGALVAPHHGADGSSTAAFLAGVRPRLVLVSAGAGNRFGHPGRAALSRFAAAAARVLRTDRDGTMTLDDSEGAWTASVEKNRRGDEREDEDQREGDRERNATRSERLRLFDEAGMAIPQPEQYQEPESVRGRSPMDHALRDDEDRETADRRPGGDAVRPRRESEQCVPTVQLSDGEQVHRGDEHADPCGPIDGADLKRRIAVEQMLEEPRAKRGTERETVQIGRRRELGGACNTEDQQR
jgi:competence protein ComEC